MLARVLKPSLYIPLVIVVSTLLCASMKGMNNMYWRQVEGMLLLVVGVWRVPSIVMIVLFRMRFTVYGV